MRFREIVTFETRQSKRKGACIEREREPIKYLKKSQSKGSLEGSFSRVYVLNIER